MGQECDHYEDKISTIDKDIKQYEALANMNNSELHEKVKLMSEEAESLKKDILLNTEEVNEVQEEFDEIQDVVKDLVNQFQLAKFSTKVGQKMQYSEETSFNENNITMYLAELEEYFATLITYIATQRGDNNAAISSIPLEQLNEKMFDKRQIEIQPPYEANGTTNDEDEGETETQKLYNKFMEQMNQGEVQILYQKPGTTKEQIKENAE